MKYQLLKLSAFAVLQALAVHSYDANDAVADSAYLAVDEQNLNDCLDRCDDDRSGAGNRAGWDRCRSNCDSANGTFDDDRTSSDRISDRRGRASDRISDRRDRASDRKPRKANKKGTMMVPASSREPKFTVDANDLVSLRLDNGDVWTSGFGSSWTERKRGRNGDTYKWKETSSDKNSVKFVDDSGRGYFARIGLRAGEVSLCDGPDSGCYPVGTIKDVTVRDSDSEEALLQADSAYLTVEEQNLNDCLDRCDDDRSGAGNRAGWDRCRSNCDSANGTFDDDRTSSDRISDRRGRASDRISDRRDRASDRISDRRDRASDRRDRASDRSDRRDRASDRISDRRSDRRSDRQSDRRGRISDRPSERRSKRQSDRASDRISDRRDRISDRRDGFPKGFPPASGSEDEELDGEDAAIEDGPMGGDAAKKTSDAIEKAKKARAERKSERASKKEERKGGDAAEKTSDAIEKAKKARAERKSERASKKEERKSKREERKAKRASKRADNASKRAASEDENPPTAVE